MFSVPDWMALKDKENSGRNGTDWWRKTVRRPASWYPGSRGKREEPEKEAHSSRSHPGWPSSSNRFHFLTAWLTGMPWWSNHLSKTLSLSTWELWGVIAGLNYTTGRDILPLFPSKCCFCSKHIYFVVLVTFSSNFRSPLSGASLPS